MNTPLYASLADSFRIHFHMPRSGITTPPVATAFADARLECRMQCDMPPQSVFVEVDTDLDRLHQTLLLIRKKAVPILLVADEAVVPALIQYADENNLGDVTFCVPYEKRALLPTLRNALPLSRGMLDCRKSGLPVNPADISADCQLAEATMALVKGVLPRETILRLQKRFVQVWTETEELIPAVLSGTCGILTNQPEQLYAALEQFPSGSVVRPTLLYAHKCLHGSGEFPENSIPGALAAGDRGYDACEIDICFTSDDVLVVQHDHDSKNLFTENCRIIQTPWKDLQKLRRKAFPDHGFDRFDELMAAMKDYPETPVLIEIKTPASTYGVEKAVAQMREILADSRSQKNATCIMGVMPPYLSYVHKHLPTLPLAHCTWIREETPTGDMDENNLRIYRFAEETKGANAGYNPYHVQCRGDFARAAHLRGITVFVWTWAFKPWEEEREPITECYMAGFDGITSDWVHCYGDLPVDLDADAGEKILRTGERVPCDLKTLTIGNDILHYCDCMLPTGEIYHFFAQK